MAKLKVTKRMLTNGIVFARFGAKMFARPSRKYTFSIILNFPSTPTDPSRALMKTKNNESSDRYKRFPLRFCRFFEGFCVSTKPCKCGFEVIFAYESSSICLLHRGGPRDYHEIREFGGGSGM